MARKFCSVALADASPIQLQSSRLVSEVSNLQPPASNLQLLEFPGGHTAGVTPVPIPNTVVKPRRADDTALVTAWERRSPPGLKTKKARLASAARAFFIFRHI